MATKPPIAAAAIPGKNAAFVAMAWPEELLELEPDNPLLAAEALDPLLDVAVVRLLAVAPAALPAGH